MSLEVGHCVECCKVLNDAGHHLCFPNRPDVIHQTEEECSNFVGLEDHKRNPDKQTFRFSDKQIKDRSNEVDEIIKLSPVVDMSKDRGTLDPIQRYPPPNFKAPLRYRIPLIKKFYWRRLSKKFKIEANESNVTFLNGAAIIYSWAETIA